MGLKANLYRTASNMKKLTADQPITYKLPKAGGFPAGAAIGAFPPPDAIQWAANPITIIKDKRRPDKKIHLFLFTDVLPPISLVLKIK
jgi:hypothetical protein